MDCVEVESQIVAYHLATLEDAERDAVAAHLLECRACLGTYLALKHASEREPLDRPSPAARARLRAEVARTFPLRGRVHPLARRIPLYQGLAIGAIAAAITLLVPSVVSRLASPHVHEGVPEVDTSRPRAESLQIY